MTEESEEELIESSPKNSQKSEDDAKLENTIETTADPSRLNYLTLFNAEYAYRVWTVCPFEQKKPYIWDFYTVH